MLPAFHICSSPIACPHRPTWNQHNTPSHRLSRRLPLLLRLRLSIRGGRYGILCQTYRELFEMTKGKLPAIIFIIDLSSWGSNPPSGIVHNNGGWTTMGGNGPSSSGDKLIVMLFPRPNSPLPPLLFYLLLGNSTSVVFSLDCIPC